MRGTRLWPRRKTSFAPTMDYLNGWRDGYDAGLAVRLNEQDEVWIDDADDIETGEELVDELVGVDELAEIVA